MYLCRPSQVIQLLHNMCKDPQTMVDIYVNYDCDLKHIDIFAKMSTRNPMPSVIHLTPGRESSQPRGAVEIHHFLKSHLPHSCEFGFGFRVTCYGSRVAGFQVKHADQARNSKYSNTPTPHTNTRLFPANREKLERFQGL